MGGASNPFVSLYFYWWIVSRHHGRDGGIVAWRRVFVGISGVVGWQRGMG